jgi:hypothetical protein
VPAPEDDPYLFTTRRSAICRRASFTDEAFARRKPWGGGGVVGENARQPHTKEVEESPDSIWRASFFINRTHSIISRRSSIASWVKSP